MENLIHWVVWADIWEVLESICVFLRSLLDFSLSLPFHICFSLSLTQTSRFALRKQVCSSAKFPGWVQHTFCSSWRQTSRLCWTSRIGHSRAFLLTFLQKNGARCFVRCLLSECVPYLLEMNDVQFSSFEEIYFNMIMKFFVHSFVPPHKTKATLFCKLLCLQQS